MKITVGIPVFNGEKFIEQTINNIINQTYSNLEILIIDDGSTDNTLKIIKQLADQDPRIKVITQKNKGIAKTRNIILENASGNYITFVDADDRIDNIAMEYYYKIISQYYPDVICTNLIAYKTENIIYKEIRNDLPYNTLLKEKEIIEYFIKPYYEEEIGIIASTCNKVYKKSFLQKNNLLFEERLKRGEDYWFNFYVFQKAQNVYALDKAFYHYYSNPQSIMKTYYEDQYENILINRKRLEKAKTHHSLNINWEEKNTQAINRISEIFLMEIRLKGFKYSVPRINQQLKNEEIRSIFLLGKPKKIHLKIIKFLLIIRMNYLIILIYYIWSFRLNKNKLSL